MSEISWTRGAAEGQQRTAPRRGPDGSPLPGSRLLGSVLPLLHDWLPAQRWFAGKGTPIESVAVLSAVELAAGSPGLLHLLLRVRHEPGHQQDCYQLLLGTRSTLPSVLAGALIGRLDGGPLDGLVVYDALHDPQLTGRLLELLSGEAAVGGLSFHRTPQAAIPAHLPGRVGTAEQSNTSVVYGDALILKVFRRVSPGTNPDLELSLALARAGCGRVPAPAAWFETPWPGGEQAGPPTTLGLLQRFLPGSADGWDLALASVPGGDFTPESFQLGRATAEVHTALARALPGAVLRRSQIDRLAEGMAERLDAAAAAVPALQPYRTALRTAFHDLAELGRRGRTLTAQRIHGDLHLGQTLRTAAGWVLLDFEGEPARPLAERRLPQPAVKDVAAMLRSFDYAARHRDPDGGPQAAEWARHNRSAYCAGYASAGETDPRSEQVLMRAFETDKAVYEVLYEARHRPAWLPIPMSAIERLAAQPPR